MTETFVSKGEKMIHEWAHQDGFVKFREDHAAVMRNLAQYIDKALRARDEEIKKLENERDNWKVRHENLFAHNLKLMEERDAIRARGGKK